MCLLIQFFIVSFAAHSSHQGDGQMNVFDPQVSLTVSPRTRYLMVHWSNSNAQPGDRILITDVDPQVKIFQRHEITDQTKATTKNSNEPADDAGRSSGTTETNYDYSLDRFLGLLEDVTSDGTDEQPPEETPKYLWKFGDPPRNVLYSMKVQEPSGWWTTNVRFDMTLLGQVTINTTCYGFWIHLINTNGTVIKSNCWTANPKWMNSIRANIGDIKIRNLFIPGTHDSGAFKLNFDPKTMDNRLNKYTITQDDEIRSQLMHGIRYLDLRVGHFPRQDHTFWIVHSISRFQPLIEVLTAVKEFVEETNEIVIIDFQEFPIGFQNNPDRIHQKLAQFVYDNMKDVFVEPIGSWDLTLNDVWAKRRNVIIGYDKPGVQFQFSGFLWESVEHRWPNKQNISSLLKYLKAERIISTM